MRETQTETEIETQRQRERESATETIEWNSEKVSETGRMSECE